MMMVRMVMVRMVGMTSMTICRQKMVPGVLSLAATRRRSQPAPMQCNAMQYSAIQHAMHCRVQYSALHFTIHRSATRQAIHHSVHRPVSLYIAVEQLHRLYRCVSV